MVAADGGDTAAYLWATLRAAPIAVPVAEEDYQAMVVVYVDDVVAFADATNVSFWASSLVAPVIASAVERVDPHHVIPGTGAPAVCTPVSDVVTRKTRS